MKRLTAFLLFLLLALPVQAQIPGGAEIQINLTPVVGGTTSTCLYITSSRKVGSQACGAGTAANIQVGVTTVGGGTTTRILYDNAGTLGEYTISGTGSVVMTSALTPYAPLAGATFTGGIGFSVTNTLDIGTNATTLAPRTVYFGTSAVGPVVNATTSVTIGAGSAITSSGAGGSLGTGAFATIANYALLTANTFTGLQTLTPSAANQGLIASTGYSLTGSDATGLIDLAGTWNTSGTPTAFKINITNTASNAASLLADIQVGGVSAFKIQASNKNATFGGAILGPSGSYGSIGGIYLGGTGPGWLTLPSTGRLDFGNDGLNAPDVFVRRRAAANFNFGDVDAATAAVAQTLSVQGVVAGTSNTAGANWTFAGSQGTGTGVGGSLIFQVAPAGSTGTAQNALATALTIDSTKLATFGAGISANGPVSANGSVTAVLASAATTSAVCYNTGTGLFTYNATVGTCTVSTITAKDIVAPLTPKDGFDLVMAMEPMRYTLKEGRATYTPGEQIGFVAEMAYEKDHRVVAMNPDGSTAGFRYEQYTAALTAAFKYLKADNDNLRAEISNLKVSK